MTRVRPVGPLAVGPLAVDPLAADPLAADPLAADRLEARLGDPLAAPAAVHHLLARLLLPRKGAQMDL